MFRKTTLKNGLRIITVPQKTAQTVTVLVLVGTGSKSETKEINGISHFLEHMMFKGTKNRPTYLEIAESLDKIGGVYNAFTGEDCTGYYAKAEKSHFDLAFDWVSDIFLNSQLPAKEVMKEKGVIIEEINMKADHPMVKIPYLWLKLLYGDQPAGWDIIGTKKAVLDMNRKKLFDYRKKHYIPANTVLCVAGNVDSRKVEKFANKYFGGVEEAPFVDNVKVVENQFSPQCLLEYRKTDQAHLFLGFRGYNIFHLKRYAHDLMAVVLGGMMSSRLFVEIREKQGLAYYIAAESENNPDTGFLAARAGVDNSRVEKAITAILKEFKRISLKKVSKQELKKSKENIKGKLALSLEASDSRASFYGMQELYEKRILTIKDVFKEIDKVSQNDILKVAKDIFKPKNLNLALMGPFKDKARFQKLLNKF